MRSPTPLCRSSSERAAAGREKPGTPALFSKSQQLLPRLLCVCWWGRCSQGETSGTGDLGRQNSTGSQWQSSAPPGCGHWGAAATDRTQAFESSRSVYHTPPCKAERDHPVLIAASTVLLPWSVLPRHLSRLCSGGGSEPRLEGCVEEKGRSRLRKEHEKRD